MNRLAELFGLGQSPWYDNIERRLLDNGTLAGMIERGELRGITSNPSIFHNAIARSHDYDHALTTMAWAGYDSTRIYEQLVIQDIQAAADLFMPLYHESEQADGYVSLEVSPYLAYDSAATLAEARRLWDAVNRPNLMIKIPATLAGIQAVRQAIGAGLNVNVTLIFSIERYKSVMDAYLSGLEDRAAMNLPIAGIASVASFFISRIDTKIDKMLDAVATPQAKKLRGQMAIANARLAYAEFRDVLASERFQKLSKVHKARLQRPLWASTSTKDPSYADTIYVDQLIGPDTVNTMPPATVTAYADHGSLRLSIDDNLAGQRQIFANLANLGIKMDKITQLLEDEGVKSFADAFTALLGTLEERRAAAVRALGPLAAQTAHQVASLAAEDFGHRIYAHDPTLWTDDSSSQDEIRRRLGWLDLPAATMHQIREIEAFKQEILEAGFTHALLLGMGGSSLAPEVFSLVFAPNELSKNVKLSILDSTDPGQVWATARKFPIRSTLFIVSSKSGGTAEVNAFFDFFWDRASRQLGERVGESFIAITDPGTSLEEMARTRGFRHTFLGDPTVGGRFSALSVFGAVPAALMGIDLRRFFDRGDWMAKQCAANQPAGQNPGLVLGAVMGAAALSGRDKLTLIADTQLGSLGGWLEQLIAESSGKEGKGIIPIDGPPAAGIFGQDRLFVYLRRDGKHDRRVSGLQADGMHPVIVYDIPNGFDLAAELYRWEYATAAACAILKVNAFDQPDVQDNKTRTLAKIDAFRESGSLAQEVPVWIDERTGGVQVFVPETNKADYAASTSLVAILGAFLSGVHASDYFGINAYLPRNRQVGNLLRRLRLAVRRQTNAATTIGFGPRFLHSTGQLHKGGPASGIFLQITATPDLNLPIPGQDITFGTLEMAQALGDFESLAARGRRVLRLHLPSPRALRDIVLIVESHAAHR